MTKREGLFTRDATKASLNTGKKISASEFLYTGSAFYEFLNPLFEFLNWIKFVVIIVAKELDSIVGVSK